MMPATAARDTAPAAHFQVRQLEVFLGHTIPGFRGPLTVRPIHDGLEHATYLIATPTERFILRAKTEGASSPLEREFRILAALNARGFPAPRPLIFSDDISVVGRVFYVMNFVEGQIITRPAMPGSTPAERAAIYDAMNDALARLHSYDPHNLGLSGLNKSSGYLESQVAHWTQVYRRSSAPANEDMEKLTNWLPGNLPPDRPLRLVHNDFSLDKLLIAPQEPKLVAVIHWETATLGDPIADAVSSALVWVTPAATAAGQSLMGLNLPELGIPTMERYLSAYASRSGLTEIPHLNRYIAYAFFRKIARLSRSGEAADPRHMAALAKIGWAFAQRAH